jgi:hypothetical protein
MFRPLVRAVIGQQSTMHKTVSLYAAENPPLANSQIYIHTDIGYITRGECTYYSVKATAVRSAVRVSVTFPVEKGVTVSPLWKRVNGTYQLTGKYRPVCPYFTFCPIFMKFRVRIIYKTLLSKRRVFWQCHLIKDVKEFYPDLPHFLTNLGEIRFVRSSLKFIKLI